MRIGERSRFIDDHLKKRLPNWFLMILAFITKRRTDLGKIL